MRTTLTLDPDVAALLRRVQAERRASLKEVVNDALRVGLRHGDGPERQAGRYTTPSDSLGGALLPSLDDVSEAIALGEGDAYR